MFSLVIATHNGAATLQRTLSAIADLIPPPGGFELLVVDNASNDRTPEILREFAARSGLNMRLFHEPRRGKSFALNRAIGAARGEFIAFTDDDVIPEPHWLTGYADAARRYPDAAIFAGQVRHEWDAPPPNWLLDLAAAGLSYGGTPVDRCEGVITARQVKGANMMVRRVALGEMRFPEDDGLNYTGQGTSAGGEDTRFAQLVSDSTGPVVFVPEACLKHIVRAHQVAIRPVYQRYVRIGRIHPIAPGPWSVLGISVPAAWRFLGMASRGLRDLAAGRHGMAARALVECARLHGSIDEGRRRRTNGLSTNKLKEHVART